ncbi:molybdenum cofactor guanylyltransferase [Nodularia spumigena CS-584]|nr:molybdenum cofactor guanylyltransferase [Nodularia spumigena]MDB9356336.1 molybdenum cofactor guanylyltransferase [Nodularia spumigena CS-587/03]KZL48529.1 molybdenum cofactor guanylyltransferase [Nodularia spumigena CENA596]MDB9319448.1 molybdenum cofactor guanylyltransferase [Nodularia spumigena CS-590/01A]MDB9322868.1 molybdenum cofactor guanylyltransferase [Nodularia spumigena CS-591/07A]MDB9326756.1 molybdenum cofactor guanylyltransferase [Nodularia spumigena CS-590/02]
MSIKHNQSLSSLILAGGKSSRMGEDKALISVGGMPLLQLVCSVASSCTDNVYVVTPWPERYEQLVLPRCQFIRELRLSPSSSHGPLVGFAQGLAQVQTDWVLLLACDLPRLRVEVLQGWASELNSVPDEAIATLVHNTKGWEPLCGFYRRRCLPQLLDFVNQGGRSFQQWLNQHPIQVLSLPASEMLFNCNTPEDLALLK